MWAMNFRFTPGFFNKYRNFHSPVQDLQTAGKLIILSNRHSNIHALLGSSTQLLQPSPLTSWSSNADISQQHQGKPSGPVGYHCLVPAGTDCRTAHHDLDPRWQLDAMQDVQKLSENTLQNSPVQIPSSLPLYFTRGNWLFKWLVQDKWWICEQNPDFSSLSPGCSGVWLQMGWSPCVEKAEQSEWSELHRRSLLCPGSHCAWKLVVWVHLSVTELLLCQQIADVVDKELVQPFEILFEGVEYIARAGWTPEGK